MPKPTHYRVICISLYNADLEACDAKVAEMKRLGHTKANRSELIRIALKRLDVRSLFAESIPLETTFRSLDGSRTRFTVTSDGQPTTDLDKEPPR